MGIVTEVWEWLGANSKQVGALASITFGLSSAAVAWLAFRMTWRNNFGWKPTILLVTYGFRGGTGQNEMFCKFEIWNRRKYPVVVREVQVIFGATLLDFDPDSGFGAKMCGWPQKRARSSATSMS